MKRSKICCNFSTVIVRPSESSKEVAARFVQLSDSDKVSKSAELSERHWNDISPSWKGVDSFREMISSPLIGVTEVALELVSWDNE